MARLSDRNNTITFVPQPQSPDVAGFVKETSDDVVPDGWLECNGQSVSTTTYPELFAKIGYTYGGSGGSFNLPGGSLLNNPTVTGDLTVDTDTLFVDASEDSVGIGITDPGSYNSSANSLVVGKTSSASGITIRSGSSNTGRIYFADGTGAGDNARGGIQYNHSKNFLSLQNGATDYLKINSSGQVGIFSDPISNTTFYVRASNSTREMNVVADVSGARAADFYVTNSSVSSSDICTLISFSGDTSPATGAALIRFQRSNAPDIGGVEMNGASNVSYQTSSDKRLKTDVKPVENALQTINMLEPVAYKWKDDLKEDVGFLAQDVYNVYPYPVSVGDNDPTEITRLWKLDYSRFAPLLVKAIQELSTKVDSLQSEIDELKGQ